MYYKVEISAEDEAQADAILNSLLTKKLVTGGQIIKAPSRFIWKGEIVDMEYVMIMSYTTETHKAAVIEDVRTSSVEEVPMITFVKIDDLNSELQTWIDQTLS